MAFKHILILTSDDTMPLVMLCDYLIWCLRQHL